MAKIDRLRELLRYDPETGALTWAVRTSTRVKVGQVAGAKRADGRVQVRVDGKIMLAHRVIWAMLHGEWPEEIDHINGDHTDNRASNLRNVDRKTNCENKRRPQSNNRLGAMGVARHNSGFSARIGTSGKTRYLGHYNSIEDAAAAYVAAKRVLHAGCTL